MNHDEDDHTKARRVGMSKAGEGKPLKALVIAEGIDRGAMWVTKERG